MGRRLLSTSSVCSRRRRCRRRSSKYTSKSKSATAHCRRPNNTHVRRFCQMGNLLNIRARHARSQMRNGITLYQQQKPQQAVRQWRSALRRLKSAEDRFLTSGYIVQAFCDSGDFDQMLHAAVQQLELANSQRDEFMRSEALLNLARANERLAEFDKAIGYASESLELPGIDNRSPGYAHLVIANAQMGLSNVQQSLQQFERAMKISIETGDKLLELQISLGLGTLFTLLRDLGKAMIFLQNAQNILHGIEANHVHAKYKSAILHQLSIILRLKGRFAEAREVCEQSIELAKAVGNKPIFARSLASLADICRELGETEARETVIKSWARYEQAFRLLRKSSDRLGQIMVLASMARSASENKGVHYAAGRCDCQAIQLNKKCLELATLIGNKHAMMECHSRLHELYNQLADDQSAEQSTRAHNQLVQQMELYCDFCGQNIGGSGQTEEHSAAAADECLQALSCSHIFHEKCLQKFFARLGNAPSTCPKCRASADPMMESSLSSSVSTAAQTPAGESVVDFFCSVPSTSAAAATTSNFVQKQNPPPQLCERNFDNSRWLSPTATVSVEAERQISLSTSVQSSSSSFSVVPKKQQPPPPLSSSFVPVQLQQQKANAMSAVFTSRRRGSNGEEGDLQTIDMEEAHQQPHHQQCQSSSSGQKQQQKAMLIHQNHVMEVSTTTAPLTRSMTPIGSNNGGGGGAGGGRSKRLLSMGKMGVLISPVAEESEEEEEERSDDDNTAMVMGGGRGVTEL